MRILLSLSLLLVVLATSAQRSSDPCLRQSKPLNIYAYKKMLRDHYNFTILGSQTPVSGFKVETNKPSITLKGNIINSPNKTFVTNLELTGGVQDDLLQLFSSNKLNGYFKATLGFNLLFENGNKAKYIYNDSYITTMTRRKVCEHRETIARQIDTMLVLTSFGDLRFQSPVLDEFISHMITEANKDEYTYNGYSEPQKFHRPIINREDYYKKLIVAMIKMYYDPEKVKSFAGDDEALVYAFMKDIKDDDLYLINSGKILSDMNRLSKYRTNRHYKYDQQNDFEIETYKDIWTSKRISWLSIVVSGSNSTFRLYDAGTETLTDSSGFLPELGVAYNFFKKWAPANKYFYIRAGLTIKRVNSLVDLEKFDYKKETIITVSPTEQLKSEKSGTAYIGDLKRSFGFDIPLELYYAPWKEPAIPGLYAKGQYRYGNAWINKNKLSFELGMIWNVVNNEKDSKNILSIIPFMGWSDFLKEYKDEAKTKVKKQSELFSVGIKFGVPVNLGK